MKAELPKPPVHHSYKVHRQQVMTQIILPILLASLLLIGVIALIIRSTFYGGGDVDRWAAISTMWILLPVIVIGIVILAVLIAVIYYLSLGLGELPKYTGIAQDYVYLGRTYILRGAKMVEQPVRAIKQFAGKLQDFFNTYMP